MTEVVFPPPRLYHHGEYLAVGGTPPLSATQQLELRRQGDDPSQCSAWYRDGDRRYPCLRDGGHEPEWHRSDNWYGQRFAWWPDGDG